MGRVEKQERVIIIGAGPTGLGAAHRLQEMGHNNFTVYERNHYVGGLAYSFCDEGGFTWDFGVHVMHSHYEYFDRLISELLVDNYYEHIRMSWVHASGAYVPYPFQYNFWHLPPQDAWDCLKGAYEVSSAKMAREPRNFKEWILSGYGSGIAKHFMLPYNKKLWTIDPKKMNSRWVGDRVPRIDVMQLLENIILRKNSVSWGPNASFKFPKKGGTGAVWRALADRLAPDNLRLKCPVKKIDIYRHEIYLENGVREKYDHLISTVPLTELTKLTSRSDLIKKARGLRHTQTVVIGVALPFSMPDELKDKTWIYCPDSRDAFYRLTPFLNFSPANVPRPISQCSLLCEVAVAQHQSHDLDKNADETLNSLRRSGIFPKTKWKARLVPMHARYGYPIPTLDRDDVIMDVMPKLERHHVYSRGRFGGWKYEVGNMDHSLMQGVEIADKIILGRRETTLFNPNIVNNTYQKNL